MTPSLQQESTENTLLGFMETETLPPLSPTLLRAFLEAFSDEDFRGKEASSQLLQSDESSAPVTSLSGALSPSLDVMTTQWHEQVITMDLSENKGDDSFETKRARRSAIEKKSRQKRQDVLRRMRQEMKRLEKVYAEKSKRHEESCEKLHVRKMNSVQHKYAQLFQVTQGLEDDRVKMLKLLESYMVFQRTAEAMAWRGVACNDEEEQEKPPRQEQVRVWDTGVPPSSSFAVQIRRRSPAECYELVRETYALTIKRFDDGGQVVSTGANFMGWTDKRTYNKAKSLHYGFTKTFPLESAEGLLMKTWDIFCHADSMAQLSFHASVTTRFEIVQTLGDDLYIIRRDYKVPNIPLNFVTVHIVFRLQTSTGYTLCMRTIPSPELQNALEPHEMYYDVFHWSHFNNAVDQDGHPAGCEISTGGYIVDVKQLVSKYWLFELVLSVLRWENMCVAPLFLKHL